MRVEPFVADAPVAPPATRAGDAGAFARSVDALGQAIGGAQFAEDAFAAGSGTLLNAVYERARADVALSVATAAAQRGAQAIQSILNMQV